MYKLRYRAVACLRVTYRETLSPILDTNRLFALLTIPIFLMLSFIAGKDVFEEAKTISISGLALLLTIPIWMVINFVLSPFRVLNEEKLSGEWVNDRLVYHSPRHVKTVLIKPSQNDQALRFKISEVPAKSFVQFKTEYDGGMGFLGITNHEKSKLFTGCSRQTQYGVRLNKKSEAVIQIVCPAESSDTVARVSILYWEK